VDVYWAIQHEFLSTKIQLLAGGDVDPLLFRLLIGPRARHVTPPHQPDLHQVIPPVGGRRGGLFVLEGSEDPARRGVCARIIDGNVKLQQSERRAGPGADRSRRPDRPQDVRRTAAAGKIDLAGAPGNTIGIMNESYQRSALRALLKADDSARIRSRRCGTGAGTDEPVRTSSDTRRDSGGIGRWGTPFVMMQRSMRSVLKWLLSRH
jgi:hypothetical protein